MKRIISVILSICLLFSITAGIDFSASAKDQISCSFCHSYNLREETTVVVEPTCIESGIIYKSIYCNDCGMMGDLSETYAVAALGHYWNSHGMCIRCRTKSDAFWFDDFTIGKHNNCFPHSSSYSNYGFWGTKTYNFKKSSTFAKFKLMATDGEKERILALCDTAWKGSCHGISTTMGMAYVGDLDIIDRNGDLNYYNLGQPCNNEDLYDSIMYYQISQNLALYSELDTTIYNPNYKIVINNPRVKVTYPEFFTGLLNLLDEDKVIGFSYGYDKETIDENGDTVIKHTGHSILITGYTKNNDGTYTLKLYDENTRKPNEEGHFSTMSLSEDKRTFSFYDFKGRLMNNETTNYLDYRSFYDFKTAETNQAIKEGEEFFKIIVPVDEVIKIVSNAGQKILSLFGGKFDGDLEIEDVSVTSSDDENNEGEAYYTITVKGEPDITVETEGEDCEIALYNDDNYISLEAENLDSAELDLENGFSINGNNCSYTAKIGDVNSDFGIYSLSANQQSDTQIGFTNNTISVKSDKSLKDVSINYSDTESRNQILDATECGNITLTNGSEPVVEKPDTEEPHSHVWTILDSESDKCTGKVTYICSCGEKKPGQITPAGHKAVIDAAVPATFTSAGKTEGAHCSVCGTVITKQNDIAKLGSPALTKLKKGKKSFTAQWSKANGVDGYQIQYSLKKNFKKATTKYSKGNKLTIKKLKSKKTYYVRVRAYKKINGKNVYSAWSTKKVKVK